MTPSKWVDLISLVRTDTGGREIVVKVADTTRIIAEASPSHRDIRLDDGETIIKIELGDNWLLHRILVNDIIVWTKDA